MAQASSGAEFSLTGSAPAPTEPLTLWYRQPAERWVEALPLGNGRLGAMVFGGVVHERIQLNEESLWEGYARDTTNPEALKALPEVRSLLFAGKNNEAAKLAESTMMGSPKTVNSYQTLGDLRLVFSDVETVSDYRRSLDLTQGIARVSYKANGVTFSREVFSSHPDQLIVIRITADQPGAVTLHAALTRQQDAVCESAGANGLVLHGQIVGPKDAHDQPAGMRFEARLEAIADGGRVRSSDGALAVEGANSVTLLLSAATDYHGGQPDTRNQTALAQGRPKTVPRNC